MNEFDELVRSEVNRRAFLTRMGAAGLGAAAAALLAGCGSGSGSRNLTTVPDGGGTTTFFDPANFPGVVGRNYNEVVLNYALTLERLEADLYKQALNLASGRALTRDLETSIPASGSTGEYTQTVGNGTIASNLAAPAFLYLVQYAYVEAAHRDFIITTLNSLGAPVAPRNPGGYTTTLNTSTATLSDIMNVILIAEEEGTRAYHGAAGYMTDTTLLTAAVAIYSTECRHSSAVNYVLGKDTGPAYIPGDLNINNASATNPIANNTFEYLRTPTQVLADVQGFLVQGGVR